MPKLTAAHIFTAASILALLFLVLAIWLIKASWLDTLFQSSNLTSNQVNAKSNIVFDDPLITLVPADQQTGEQKTKVFVSTLDPVLGEPTAKVYLIFYGSLLDADMATYLALIPTLNEAYSDDVSFVWKDNATTANETFAAAVAHCANEYNTFWELAGALSTRTDDSETAIVAVAESLALDGPTLRDCVATTGYAGQIKQSQAAAANLGVANGHTLFINDRLFTEPIDEATIKRHIDEILATF